MSDEYMAARKKEKNLEKAKSTRVFFRWSKISRKLIRKYAPEDLQVMNMAAMLCMNITLGSLHIQQIHSCFTLTVYSTFNAHYRHALSPTILPTILSLSPLRACTRLQQ